MFDGLRELYQEVILDHGRKPRHGRRLEAFDVSAKGDNPMCGDRIEVFVAFDRDGNIDRVGFEARGCAISVASADLMAEAVLGLTVEQVGELSGEFMQMLITGEARSPGILQKLRPLAGVHEFPSRLKCASLAWHALCTALDQTAGEGS